MMHPYAAVVGFYDEPLESWLGPTGQSIQSMQFYETDESRGFVRGGKWQVMSTGGPLGLRAAYGGAPLEERFGESLHRNLREQLGRGLEWGVIAEDLPEDSNYIALDAELTDSDGIAAPKDRLPQLRQHARAARLPSRATARGARRRRRAQDGRDAAHARLRLAPARHLQDGRRSRDLGRRCRRAGARRAESLRLRRQRLPDVGGRQPARDDRGGQPALHGAPDRDARIARRCRRERARPGAAGSACRRARPGSRGHAQRDGGRRASRGTRSRARGAARPRAAARPRPRNADGEPGDVLRRLQASDEAGLRGADAGSHGRLLHRSGGAPADRLPGPAVSARARHASRPTGTRPHSPASSRGARSTAARARSARKIVGSSSVSPAAGDHLGPKVAFMHSPLPELWAGEIRAACRSVR